MAQEAVSAWLGRLPKGERCTHSFAAFVRKAKTNKAGKAHLVKHHRGYGLK